MYLFSENNAPNLFQANNSDVLKRLEVFDVLGDDVLTTHFLTDDKLKRVFNIQIRKIIKCCLNVFFGKIDDGVLCQNVLKFLANRGLRNPRPFKC